MIQQITSPLAIHTEIVEEKDNEMTDFMDRLHAVLSKFQNDTFQHEGKSFKAKLFKRSDTTKQISVTERYEHSVMNFVVSTKTKVVLEFKFVPLEIDLSRTRFLSE